MSPQGVSGWRLRFVLGYEIKGFEAEGVTLRQGTNACSSRFTEDSEIPLPVSVPVGS